jgi:dephospho-CoA kinase
MSAPLHLGLTGNIAAGKSTVAALLAQHGATVIDADVLAREAVAPGTAGFDAVVARFGPRAVAPDGTLDRAWLRSVVFSDPAARDALSAIVHPEVGRLRAARLAEARARGDRIVVSDIPLLFEVGLEHTVDGVILVDAPEAERLRRLVDDRGLPEAQARAMMAAQLPAAEKRRRATWIVDNDGSRAQLAERVAALWRRLEQAAASPAAGATG